ncbi:MAG TPA: NUDIX hydrolase [Spirochaetia bacterium]|nr:NUDIX hydrolase [Spirochaetia bacterium]
MKIERTETLCPNPWVQFKQKVYLDADGTEKGWAYVERVNRQRAVFMVPIDPRRKQLLLIRQYRLPLEGYVVEFPAGLIDPGESPETTAVRELKEETGFTGELLELSRPLALSAGITNETAYLARMRVDLDPARQVAQEVEAVEEIEVLIVPLQELRARLQEREKAGDVIDAKLFCLSQSLLLEG